MIFEQIIEQSQNSYLEALKEEDQKQKTRMISRIIIKSPKFNSVDPRKFFDEVDHKKGPDLKT